MSHIPLGVTEGDVVLDERKYASEKVIITERRGAELADEFTRLEVQISTVLLAFVGLFFDPFLDGLEDYNAVTVLTLQWFYALIVITLVGSLVLGLIHIKRKETWWNDMHCEWAAQLKIWNSCVCGDCELSTARSSIKAIRSARHSEILRSPKWTWILQSILLGVAVALILILFLTLIFI